MKMKNENQNILQDILSDDGIDRRGMLECMAWVGTGLISSMTGGLASSRVFGKPVSYTHLTLPTKLEV
jgi:Icc protein